VEVKVKVRTERCERRANKKFEGVRVDDWETHYGSMVRYIHLKYIKKTYYEVTHGRCEVAFELDGKVEHGGGEDQICSTSPGLIQTTQSHSIRNLIVYEKRKETHAYNAWCVTQQVEKS
jgi:hypothetical protein